MKFNEMTHTASLGVLAATALYTLLYSGLMGVLVTSAIGFIAYAFIDQLELVVAVTVLFAFFYTVFLKKFVKRLEGFKNDNTPADIRARVASMNRNYHQKPHDLRNPRKEPAGVYEPSIEGFADASDSTKASEEGGAPSESSAASTKATVNQVGEKQVKEVTSTITGEKHKENKEKSDKEVQDEEFKSATNNLFKLGKMPSENMGGPKLDAGQTIVKAMESMDPSTVNSMTMDTKKLLETQKGLMSMLTQMRPVLADGKELLQTFSGMFGGLGANSSGGSGGPFKLG